MLTDIKIDAQMDIEDNMFMPMVVSLRKNIGRMGPDKTPWSTMGQFIFATDKVGIMAIELQPVIQSGEVRKIADVPNEMDDMDTKRKLPNFPFALLDKGDYTWIPFGYCPLLQTPEGVASCLVVPWAAKERLNALDEAIKELVEETIVKRAKHGHTKKPWSILYEPTKAFFKASGE